MAPPKNPRGGRPTKTLPFAVNFPNNNSRTAVTMTQEMNKKVEKLIGPGAGTKAEVMRQLVEDGFKYRHLEQVIANAKSPVSLWIALGKAADEAEMAEQVAKDYLPAAIASILSTRRGS